MTDTLIVETDQAIGDALTLFVELSNMAIMQYYPEADLHKWSKLVNKEASQAAHAGLSAWHAKQREISMLSEDDFMKLVGKINGPLGDFTRIDHYAAQQLYAALQPYLRAPKREAQPSEIPGDDRDYVEQ